MSTERRTADVAPARRLHAELGCGCRWWHQDRSRHPRRPSTSDWRGSGWSIQSLRVGIAGAAAAVREAIDNACASAKLRRGDLVAAQIGLAGARRRELREHAETPPPHSISVKSKSLLTLISLLRSDWRRAGLVADTGTGNRSAAASTRDAGVSARRLGTDRRR